MRSILSLTLIFLAQILSAQLLPVPLEFYATRYGKIVPMALRLCHRPPFRITDASNVDSIFQCEEITYQFADSIVKKSQCPFYQWPYPDTAIRVNSGFEPMVCIPLFERRHHTQYYSYSKINDSTWIGADSLRSWSDKEKWHLDKNGFTQRVEVCSNNDSVIATYYYSWYADGRIKSVTQIGVPRVLQFYTDTLPVGSFEYLYDEDFRFRAYCTHAGRPYTSIADSVIEWTRICQRVYADSFPTADLVIIIPPSSSLGLLVTYTYTQNKLTSVFNCSQFGGGTDTLFYDEEQHIDRVRSYINGNKHLVTEFEYDKYNRIRRVRTIRNGGYRPDDFYTYTFEYGALGKISDILLPLDKYSGNIIRHAYHLIYRLGN